jgi:hypothetical protein
MADSFGRTGRDMAAPAAGECGQRKRAAMNRASTDMD